MSGIYRVVRAAIRLALPLQTRLSLTSVEHLPATAPTLLVSNHLSAIDPFIIGALLSRQLRILAKAELFDWPVVGGLSRLCGVVPIHRGEWDLAALSTLQDAFGPGAVRPDLS